MESLGFTDEATTARSHVRERAAYMLSTLDGPDLRAAFLNLPENYLLREPQDS